MAKIEATKRSKRRSKVVTSEAVEEEDNVNTEEQAETVSPSEQTVVTEEDAPKEDQEEQDSQMDAVIEVKGSTTTVAVTWDQKNEDEGEVDDTEKTTDASDQIMDSEEQIISSADAGGSTEDAPSESAETKMEQEVQESEEPLADIVAGSTASVTVTYEEKNEEGENDQEVQEETEEVEEIIVKKTPVKGKRKAPAAVETSPPKKTKLLNDGFCLYVGNLNNFKPFEEIKDSLANYFMTQSVLVQDIRLDRSRKHAHIDLASEMDLTKALTLNGEMMHDKPMKIAKAKVKSEDKVEDKKGGKNGRCLFLKNVPFNATKEDILKVFRKAVAVRFPDGAKGPKKGIAFVEFENKTIAEKVRQQKQGVKIQDRILIVDSTGGTKVPKVTEDNDDKDDTKAAALQKNTLFVSKLPFNVQEKDLKKVFQKAVNISIPQGQGKARGFAFVEFAAVADAEKALQSSKNIKICNKPAKVQFCNTRGKSGEAKVLSKTLIVLGLAEKTTAETLKSAFEGSFKARVLTDKDTGLSKRFGFVDFESEDDCKAVKQAMEDCEIDGSKVTVAYAKPKSVKGPAKSPRA